MVRLGGGGRTIGVPGGTNDEINRQTRGWELQIERVADSVSLTFYHERKDSGLPRSCHTCSCWRSHLEAEDTDNRTCGSITHKAALLESDHSLIAKHQKARDWGQSWWLQSWDHTPMISVLRRPRKEDCYKFKQRGKTAYSKSRSKEGRKRLGSHNPLGGPRPNDLNTSH